jgi:hypothetical protein
MVCCSLEMVRKWTGNARPRLRVRWSFGRLLDWHFIHGTRHGDLESRGGAALAVSHLEKNH